MGDTHDSTLKDTLLVIQKKLNLFWVDVVSTRDYQVLVAPNDVQVAVFIDLPKVTSDEEAVFPQFLGCFLGHLPIPFEDVGATHLNLADVPLG